MYLVVFVHLFPLQYWLGGLLVLCVSIYLERVSRSILVLTLFAGCLLMSCLSLVVDAAQCAMVGEYIQHEGLSSLHNPFIVQVDLQSKRDCSDDTSIDPRKHGSR